MSNPFVAEIRAVPFNFPPKGWAFCDGQLLPISQNTALFSLLGTFYGGDGKSTFALPDLQGMTPIHAGPAAANVSEYSIGETGGALTVSLLQSEIPAHTHQMRGSAGPGTTADPTNATWAVPRYGRVTEKAYVAAPTGTMNPQTIAPAGGDQPHNNMQPYLTLNFIIALQGVYPQRP